MKERVIPNKNKVYQYFKNYVTSNISNNEELLKDLLKHSKYYKRIINPNQLNDKVSIELSKINRLESVVTYPFLMEVFDDFSEEIINEDDLIKILQIIISFVFRRLICDVPTNALNKIFMVLGREIKKYDDYKNEYLEIFKRVITQKRSSQRFPDDDEFKSKIITKDIYNFKSKNKLFLLEQLENFENKERVDIENLVSTNELTIEHIMPQTLTPIWKKSLGEDYNNIYEKYLNTLGNITLTGYNSKLSNKPFLEKRDMNKGFKESRLFLNKLLSSFEEWNETSIKKRANFLRKKALNIWQYPDSNYQFTIDDLKNFTLDDDDTNFTGEKVLSFKVMEDKEINVSSWKDFYKKTSKILFELDPIKFKQISESHKYIYNGNILKDTVKVDDFYLYSNLNIEAFLYRLRILAKGINLDLNEVIFILE